MTRREWLAAAAGAVAGSAYSWIDVDLLHGTRRIEWPDVARPIGYGSLLKPFLVLAYAATHNTFPEMVCHGTRDRCWLPRGHGMQTIVPALAHSCNAYFLQLTKMMDRAALDSVCLRYGLTRPDRALREDSLIGLGAEWKNSPLAVVQAFAQLKDPLVLEAMQQCAQTGTAQNLELDCYAKTGTAPCAHLPRAAGDGFVAVMYPTGQPRRVVLFRQDGTTGAEACRAVKRKIDFR